MKRLHRTLLIISLIMGLTAPIAMDAQRLKGTRPQKKTQIKIPKEAIKGDFDGDGKTEYVWTDGNFDEFGMPIGAVTLRSNNPRLNGHKWTDGAGYWLINLGKLDNSGRDYLGAIRHGQSSWCVFETYGFRSNSWKKVLKPFSVWLGNENERRVVRSKRPGYVTIIYNDMDELDDGFPDHRKDVKLKF